MSVLCQATQTRTLELSVFLSLVALSFAQDPETIEVPERVVIPDVQYVEFGYTRVDGKVIGPDGHFLPERPKAVFNPLIELRLNFDTEMDQSVSLMK